MTSTRFLSAIAAAALLLAACGSDDADLDTAGDPPAAEGTDHEDGGEHEHSGTEVLDGATVSFTAEPDAMVGFNLIAEIDGFTFAPEHASTDHIDGEGHAHLYVDGDKVGRLYGPAFHLTGLTEGDHEVTFELNTNDHRAYVDADDAPIAATETITVTAEQAAATGHSHGGDDPVVEAETLDGATLSFTADADAKAGFNVIAEIDGFTFAPEHASTDHIDGEGHAHLYVDGDKVGRLYGPAFHLTGLTEGDHEVTFELNTNDHRPYLDSTGKALTATQTITVSTEQAAEPEVHDHGATDATGDAPEGAVIVTVAGGSVDGPDRHEVSTGDTVDVRVTSDVADEVHVHGTDEHFAIAAGETIDFSFTASIPGVFEVELEDSGLLLFELAVR